MLVTSLSVAIGAAERGGVMSNSPRTGVRQFHNYAPWVNVILGLLVFILRYASPRGTFDVHWNLFLTGVVIMFAALASTIAVTGNLRNWRHFLLMRTSVETHPDFRKVTIPLLECFKQRVPLLFDDIEPMDRQISNLKKPR